MSFIEELKTYEPHAEFAKAAKARALELGVPTKKNENWKYTNLEKYLPSYDLPQQEAASIKNDGLSEAFDHVFFINGKLSTEEGHLKLSSNEEALSSFKKEMGDLLEDDFAFQLTDVQDATQYLLEIDAPKERPIWIHHLYTNEMAKHSSSHLHVRMKKSSEAHFIETHETLNPGEVFSNHSTSFYLEENSKAHHVKVQILNNESTDVHNIRAQVCRDANFESLTVDTGGKLSRNNISIRLNEEGASCAAHGLYALSGEAHSDTNSYIRHAKGHTDSSQLYKGIMADKSHGIFAGIIRMDKDAQLCNSEQLNKNLLLSKGAHAHSRPQLEIFADDVKAAHGSTTGQLSDEELFYFQSRGVSPERAQRLLAHAFLNDVLLKIQNKESRKAAAELLSKNFKALGENQL